MKVSNIIVQTRRDKVYALVMRGVCRPSEIARTLNVSQRVAEKDLGWVHTMMVAASKKIAATRTARQLARIDHLIKENAVAWEESRKPKVVEEERTVVEDGVSKVTRVRRTEYQSGNPAFTREIRELLKREAELLALDALPASQKRQADVASAQGIMQLMRLVEINAEAEIVTGPVIEARAALPAPEEDDEAGVVLDLSSDFGRANGNGHSNGNGHA